jgi:hypothetical protein
MVSVLLATPIGQAAGNFVLSKNSVGTAQIKKNAVNSLKVKNGTLMAADFKAGQLPAGPQGSQGPKGDPGPKGDSGVAHLTVMNRQGPWTDVPAMSTVTAKAQCQPGEVATGGGPVGLDPGLILLKSNAAEVPTPITWRVTVQNTTGAAQNFSVEVVCAAT